MSFRTASYTNNGDGTVTDNNTLLMWEQKVAGSGCLHCVDDVYTFAATTSGFLAAINAEGGSGLGGHSDWRIPNVKELQSIVDYGVFNPSIDPVPVFGDTAFSTTTFYWSSSTRALLTTDAWHVGFVNGAVNFHAKSNANFVRAVRGGCL